LSEGESFISLRRLRAAVIAAFSFATHASAAASTFSSCAFGYGAVTMPCTAPAARPATGATRSQSSAVTNGVIGWSSRSTVSSVRISVRRVARCCGSVPDCSCTFAISRYQSQYSSQTNE